MTHSGARFVWLLVLLSCACASSSTTVTNPERRTGSFGEPDPVRALSSTAAAPALADPCSAATGPTVAVNTTSALVAVLASATAGTTIRLADATYSGNFATGPHSGSAQQPIAICGSRAAILNGGSTASGIVLHITQSYWVISGITIQNGQKGVVLDGATHTLLTGIMVAEIGDEGVHFRSNSSDNRLTQSEVRSTGKYQAGFGEGVYIGSAVSNWGKYTGGAPDRSDRNVVDNNTIADTAAECVDIKEGSSFGTVAGNRLDGGSISGQNYADSWIDVKGQGYTIVNNVGVNASGKMNQGFQVHVVSTDAGAIPNSGNGNVFSGNAFNLTGSPATAAVWIQSTTTGNIVRCDNTVTPRSLPLLAAGSCS